MYLSLAVIIAISVSLSPSANEVASADVSLLPPCSLPHLAMSACVSSSHFLFMVAFTIRGALSSLLSSPPFLMFSDYQKSVEMKAPKSRPDHRRNAAVGLKSFAAPELRMNLHSVVKLKLALQLSLMLCQKSDGRTGPERRSLPLAFARCVGSASCRLNNVRKRTRRRT